MAVGAQRTNFSADEIQIAPAPAPCCFGPHLLHGHGSRPAWAALVVYESVAAAFNQQLL